MSTTDGAEHANVLPRVIRLASRKSYSCLGKLRGRIPLKPRRNSSIPFIVRFFVNCLSRLHTVSTNAEKEKLEKGETSFELSNF